MKKAFTLILLAIILIFNSSCSTSYESLTDYAFVIESENAIATGFFIDNKGGFLSCGHFVGDKNTIEIDKKVYEAEKTSISDLDMALFKVNYSTKNYFEPKYREITLGEEVKIITNISDIGVCILSGKVAKNVTDYQLNGTTNSWFCIEADTGKGTSGAPVVNKNNQLIGIVVKKVVDHNIALAIPIDTIIEFLKEGKK